MNRDRGDININERCEGNRFDFAMMPRENYEERIVGPSILAKSRAS